MNKRKQIITDVLLNDDFSNVQENMSSKRTYIATFWRSNPQLKNGGYYTTKEFQAMSHKAAERQAERYMKDVIYGSLNLISVELKQENSNGK